MRQKSPGGQYTFYKPEISELKASLCAGLAKWDPVQFSLQWPELVEMGRVLLRKLVERMESVGFDVVKLAEIVVSKPRTRSCTVSQTVA